MEKCGLYSDSAGDERTSNMKALSLVVLFALLAGALGGAEDIRIVAPYLGVATNVYSDDQNGIDITDSKLMEGLYFQWINTELFQANAFLYHSADINFSQLWGGHAIADFYVLRDPLGKVALGAGLEILSLDMDAGSAFPPLTKFTLPTTFYIPYARAGHYFDFTPAKSVQLTVFPWAGAEYQVTRGEVSFVPPGPPSKFTQSIDDETLYGIAGLNVHATIMHFIDLEAKYSGTFNQTDYLSTFDGMVNVFFTRNWGVSYRYKYMQQTSGSTSYHIFGVAYVF